MLFSCDMSNNIPHKYAGSRTGALQSGGTTEVNGIPHIFEERKRVKEIP